jgi:hypothetical protein
MFPKIRLTETEVKLQRQSWKTRFKVALMEKMQRVNLRYDEFDCWGLEYSLVYDGDGYKVILGFPRSWGSTTKYITFLPQDGPGLMTIFKPHIMVEDEWLDRWNRAVRETQELIAAWDEAWIQCGGLAGK